MRQTELGETVNPITGVVIRDTGRGPCEDGGGGRSYASKSQGIPGATRSWET